MEVPVSEVTTNAIESVNARLRKAVRARWHFPNEAAHPSCTVGWTEPTSVADLDSDDRDCNVDNAPESAIPPSDAHEARSRIIQGRLNGLSQRQTARWDHRSPTFVRKVWTAMDDEVRNTG